MKESTSKALKVIHIILSVAIVIFLIAGVIMNGTKAVQLSGLREDSQSYLNKSDPFDLVAKTCFMDGCTAEKQYDFNYSFQSTTFEDVVFDIPNKANFEILRDDYIDSDTFVDRETEDVYFGSIQMDGDFEIYQGEVTTETEYEVDRQEMYATTFKGSYCSAHAQEAVDVLIDEIEVYFNQNIMYFLCIGLAPYNLIFLPALIALLYWLIRTVPRDICTGKRIREGTKTHDRVTAKKNLKDDFVLCLICLIILVVLLSCVTEFDSFLSYLAGVICVFLGVLVVGCIGTILGNAYFLSLSARYQKEEKVVE